MGKEASCVQRENGARHTGRALLETDDLTLGLTATKVARFSETHTAEKLVIPVAKR